MMDPKNVIPMVVETGTRGSERAFDIYSLLAEGTYRDVKYAY